MTCYHLERLASRRGYHTMRIRVTVQMALLLLLVGGMVLPVGLSSSSTSPVQAQVTVPGACQGDEVITFAPTRPAVGQELRIAVTSATKHRNVYLAGSEPVTTVSETPGQRGIVWLWSLIPQEPGPHSFEFFVDFTTFCAAATIDVVPSPLSPMTAGLTPGSTAVACPTVPPPGALQPLGAATPPTPAGAAAPVGYATPTLTATPTRTPYPTPFAYPTTAILAGTASPLGSAPLGLTPYPTPFACATATLAGAAWPLDSAPGLATDPTPFVYPTSLPFTEPTPTPFDYGLDGNDNTSNSNGSISSNDNSFDNTNNSNTDELDKPSISSASCSGSGNQRLRIKGDDFGESLAVASGRVLVHDVASDDAVDVSTYLSWTTKEIDVLVQGAVRTFDEVYVVTSGGAASKELSASCST